MEGPRWWNDRFWRTTELPLPRQNKFNKNNGNIRVNPSSCISSKRSNSAFIPLNERRRNLAGLRKKGGDTPFLPISDRSARYSGTNVPILMCTGIKLDSQPISSRQPISFHVSYRSNPGVHLDREPWTSVDRTSSPSSPTQLLSKRLGIPVQKLHYLLKTSRESSAQNRLHPSSVYIDEGMASGCLRDDLQCVGHKSATAITNEFVDAQIRTKSCVTAALPPVSNQVSPGPIPVTHCISKKDASAASVPAHNAVLVKRPASEDIPVKKPEVSVQIAELKAHAQECFEEIIRLTDTPNTSSISSCSPTKEVFENNVNLPQSRETHLANSLPLARKHDHADVQPFRDEAYSTSVLITDKLPFPSGQVQTKVYRNETLSESLRKQHSISNPELKSLKKLTAFPNSVSLVKSQSARTSHFRTVSINRLQKSLTGVSPDSLRQHFSVIQEPQVSRVSSFKESKPKTAFYSKTITVKSSMQRHRCRSEKRQNVKFDLNRNSVLTFYTDETSFSLREKTLTPESTSSSKMISVPTLQLDDSSDSSYD